MYTRVLAEQLQPTMKSVKFWCSDREIYVISSLNNFHRITKIANQRDYDHDI